MNGVSKSFSLIALFLWCGAACSSSSISSLFVARSVSEVDMFNLVEAPAGHLSGTFVVSSINEDGTRNKDAVHNVSGSIFQNNVSIQIDNGILEHPTSVVGKLHGNSLTLTFGNSAVIFQTMSQQEYQGALADLDRTAEKQREVVAAKNAATDLDKNLAKLRSDLKSFTEWGTERITRAPSVHKWYVDRLAKYQQCLDRIQPLAQRHVPVWKWQSCVLQVQNDSYQREEIADAVTGNASKEKTWENNLNERLANIQQMVAYVAAKWGAVCKLTKDANDCEQKLTAFNSNATSTFEHEKVVSDYTALLPKVRQAMNDEVQFKTDGDRKLSDVARQIDALYNSASNTSS